MTDPISDLLARIRNGQTAKHDNVRVPFSRLKLEVLKILYQEGYIGGYKMQGGEGVSKVLEIALRYVGKKEPVIAEMIRVSRPGRRVYVGYEEVPLVKGGMGVAILSTSKGILTDRQARGEKLGGELLCTIW